MVDCRVILVGWGWLIRHRTAPCTTYAIFVFRSLLFWSERMDDEDIHSTVCYLRILLSYTVREATAIEEREDQCIFDDEGRVG